MPWKSQNVHKVRPKDIDNVIQRHVQGVKVWVNKQMEGGGYHKINTVITSREEQDGLDQESSCLLECCPFP